MHDTRQLVLRLISFAGLALSALPAFLVLAAVLTKETYLWCMLLGMLLWFGSAVCWIKPGQQPS